MTNKKKLLSKGFTLVELIIVITVIGILASIATVNYRGYRERALDASIVSDLDNMDSSQTNYALNHNAVGKAYYSKTDGIDSDLGFTPTKGNVIDVVIDDSDYCIRGYNTKSNKKTIATATIQESSAGACSRIAPSDAALAP